MSKWINSENETPTGRFFIEVQAGSHYRKPEKTFESGEIEINELMKTEFQWQASDEDVYPFWLSWIQNVDWSYIFDQHSELWLFEDGSLFKVGHIYNYEKDYRTVVCFDMSIVQKDDE